MYFKDFPKFLYDFNYGNNTKTTVVTDITRNVRFRKHLLSNVTLYDEYDMMDGETPEIIAEKFYGSPEYHWIVMLANGKYDWKNDFPLPEDVLQRHIVQQYNPTLYASSWYVEDTRASLGYETLYYKIDATQPFDPNYLISPVSFNISGSTDTMDFNYTYEWPYENGKMLGIDWLVPGQGYTNPPTVNIVSSNGIGSGAAATTTINPRTGLVTGFNITNHGSGYVAPPKVYIGTGGSVVWSPSTLVLTGSFLKASDGQGGFNYYIVTFGGTTSRESPTHTSGTVTNGTVQLKYVVARDYDGFGASGTAFLGNGIDFDTQYFYQRISPSTPISGVPTGPLTINTVGREKNPIYFKDPYGNVINYGSGVIPVSGAEIEREANDKKRRIKIIAPALLETILKNYEELLR